MKMTDEMFACSCGFKCVDTQLAKSEGACPKCGKRTTKNKDKYGDVPEQTNIHKKIRGEL